MEQEVVSALKVLPAPYSLTNNGREVEEKYHTFLLNYTIVLGFVPITAASVSLILEAVA